MPTKIDVGKLIGKFVLETGKAEHALDNFLVCLSNEYPDVLEKRRTEFKKQLPMNWEKQLPMNWGKKITLLNYFIDQENGVKDLMCGSIKGTIFNDDSDDLNSYFEKLEKLHKLRNKIVHGSIDLTYSNTDDEHESYIRLNKFKIEEGKLYLSSYNIHLIKIENAVRFYKTTKLIFWEAKRSLEGQAD